MGILDLFLNPTEPTEPEPRKLSKKQRKKLCSHEYQYQKWVHNGPIQGVTFHIKKVCHKCGIGKYVPRTKETYLLTKNDTWHKSKNVVATKGKSGLF